MPTLSIASDPSFTSCINLIGQISLFQYTHQLYQFDWASRYQHFSILLENQWLILTDNYGAFLTASLRYTTSRHHKKILAKFFRASPPFVPRANSSSGDVLTVPTSSLICSKAQFALPLPLVPMRPGRVTICLLIPGLMTADCTHRAPVFFASR